MAVQGIRRRRVPLNFCTRYYGPDHAADIARLYRDYYQAYWTQKPADIPGFDRQYIFQDMRYARATEMLLKDMAASVYRLNPLDGNPLDDPSKGSVGYFRVEPQPGDTNQVGALLRGTTESGQKFAAVVARANALLSSAGQGRIFFHDNLLARAKIMVALNALLDETTLAYQAKDVLESGTSISAPLSPPPPRFRRHSTRPTTARLTNGMTATASLA